MTGDHKGTPDRITGKRDDPEGMTDAADDTRSHHKGMRVDREGMTDDPEGTRDDTKQSDY
jgi:hypothetical protein